MKKINLLFLAVLFSMMAFANVTDEGTSSASGFTVVNLNHSSIFKVIYKAAEKSNVKLSILDNKGVLIFQETMRQTDGFVRPYNFVNIGAGEYVIELESGNSKRAEKIIYSTGKIERTGKVVNINKLAGQENKYVVALSMPAQDIVTINIFDEAHELIHSETHRVHGEFGQVYNLKKLKSFTIEISDSSGLVKTVKY